MIIATDTFVIGTIIIWILYDIFALFMGYRDGVKTRYTISYRIAVVCKKYKFVEIIFLLSVGVLLGHFLWHQCPL